MYVYFFKRIPKTETVYLDRLKHKLNTIARSTLVIKFRFEDLSSFLVIIKFRYCKLGGSAFSRAVNSDIFYTVLICLVLLCRHNIIYYHTKYMLLQTVKWSQCIYTELWSSFNSAFRHYFYYEQHVHDVYK